MKVVNLFCLIVLVVLSSCKQGESTRRNTQELSASPEKPLVKSSENTLEDLVGLWKFTYPYSGSLIEDHYMKIGQEGTGLSGAYYGTTDDFDRAREGYLPGFFRADMQDISFNNDTLSFRLEIREDELYQEPIPLTLNSGISYGGEKWEYGISFKEKEYKGIYKNGRVVLFTRFDPREFLRTD